MKRVIIGLSLLVMVATGPLAAADWGDLRGRFVYDGEAPKRAKLQITRDLECCGKYLDEIVNESVTVGPQSGLANVFIYIRVAQGKKIDVHPDLVKKAAESTIVLDNIHCRFEPHAFGLWVGKQKLVFKNSDPIGHAVKIDFLKNTPINVLLAANQEIEHKLQTPEQLPTTASCGVHPWESAFIKVHDSPYFAVTAPDGKFAIEKIPVGEWEFQVWHEKSGFLPAKSEWSKGRFKLAIKAGENDLGTIKVSPKLFQKK